MSRCWILLACVGLLLALLAPSPALAGAGEPAPAPRLFITEVSAQDEWVEIFNPEPVAVALSRLRDGSKTVLDLDEWIGPGEYRVYEVPFKISNQGDRVRLSWWSGKPGFSEQRSHEIDVPAAISGMTYGLTVVDDLVLEDVSAYMEPTPGWRNGSPRPVSPLAITEIHYRPLVSDGVRDDALQFVELRNTGSAPLNLAGYRFDDGIEFAFSNTVVSAGGYVLVVSNRVAFERVYGTGLPIAGQFNGRLSDDTERLAVVTPSGVVAAEVTYSDEWSPLTDGPGFSLVRRDESVPGFADDRALWRSSSRPGGSPGRTDPEGNWPRVVINEILSRPVAPYEGMLELRNLESVEVNISGWYLSDRRERPRKFRLPAGTLLPPHGYLAIDEHTFNPKGESEAFTTFGLNPLGETIWLFSADADGQLTGYGHEFRYRGSDPNVSIGRHVDSAGREHFVAQTEMTFGAPNAGPVLGPLVISEIGPRGDEFIEWHNRSDRAVLLYPVAPPDASSNYWALSGVADVHLPAVSLAPGARMVAVKGDPLLFRVAHAVPGNVFVMAWNFGVSLPANGGTIRLERVESIPLDSDGTEYGWARIPVDEVSYSASSPWPSVPARHVSLQLRDPALFSDDPGNWVVAAANPGRSRPLAEDAGKAPRIVSQTGSLQPAPVAPVAFAVTAEGEQPLSYQWSHNGSPLKGATASLLTLTSAVPATAGIYECAVANAHGTAISEPMVLRVPAAPLWDDVAPGFAIFGETNGPLVLPGETPTVQGVIHDDLALGAMLGRPEGGSWALLAGDGAWPSLANADWSVPVVPEGVRTRWEFMAVDRRGNLSEPRSLELVTDHYAASVRAIGPGTVAGLTNGQKVQVGASYPVVATPEAGAYFQGWQDATGRVWSVSSAVNVTAGDVLRLTAVFGAAPVVQLRIEGQGTISGLTNGQVLTVGAFHRVAATPGFGQRFAGWWDGEGNPLSTDRSYSLRVTASAFVVARFEPDPAVTQLRLRMVGGGTVSGAVDGQLLTVGSNWRLVAKPAAGRMFVRWFNGVGEDLGRNPVLKLEVPPGEFLDVGAQFVSTDHFAGVRGRHLALFSGGSLLGEEFLGSMEATVGAHGGVAVVIRFGSRTGIATTRLDETWSARVPFPRRLGFPVVANLRFHPNQVTNSWTGDVRVFDESSSLTGHRQTETTVASAGAIPLLLVASVDGVSVGSWGGGGGLEVRTLAWGNCALKGVLPDGSKVSGRCRTTVTGLIPLDMRLYGGHGRLHGWISTELGATNQLRWICDGRSGGPVFNRVIDFLPVLHAAE